MGIADYIMGGLIEESRFKPFSGVACTFGRQTMAWSPAETIAQFAARGVEPRLRDEISVDRQTTNALRDGNSRILDASFFEMLGFDRFMSVDVSDFEGAEVITDLNSPLDPRYENSCDLLVDGSLLDNIFDPVTGLRNAARLVRPGGRLLLINRGNYTKRPGGIPYLQFTGVWFYDFFAINGFSDLQVYACCVHDRGVVAYMLDHTNMTRQFGGGIVAPLNSSVAMFIVAFAEKGVASTWHRTPTQHAYRSPEEWERYEAAVQTYKSSKRPPMLRSVYRALADEFCPGWVFVDDTGQIRRPYHENVEDLLATRQ
jgi:hypothetical protein